MPMLMVFFKDVRMMDSFMIFKFLVGLSTEDNEFHFCLENGNLDNRREGRFGQKYNYLILDIGSALLPIRTLNMANLTDGWV